MEGERNMYTLELARPDELQTCWEIIAMGRNFQKEQGFTQWTEDYPNPDTIRDDIEAQKGYVIKADGRIAGYMCVDFDGEPAYNDIEGEWHTKAPYAVVHRMAFHGDFRGRGLADVAFRLIEKLCLDNQITSIRVDTDFPNKRMQHILEKNGFVKRGVIVFQGSGKLAYDKALE